MLTACIGGGGAKGNIAEDPASFEGRFFRFNGVVSGDYEKDEITDSILDFSQFKFLGKTPMHKEIRDNWS